MVKIFVGNLASDTTVRELRQRFENYGKVTECDIVKNFGFVHMSSMSEAEEAIKNLHQTELNGWRMNVEMSKGRAKSTTKLHVSNLGEGVTDELLRAKFQEFGPVVECDIVKNYAFVHMERMEDAMEAIQNLDNTAFKGKLMNVQLSTSRLRTAPGMGDHSSCFVCGKEGHWSKDCPSDRDASYGDVPRSGRVPPHGMASGPVPDYMGSSMYSQPSYPGGFPPPTQPLPPPPPPPPSLRPSGYAPESGYQYASQAAASYPDRSSAYDQSQLYSSLDYYGKYRVRPYGSSYFEERRTSYLPPAVPPSSSLSTTPSAVDPYRTVPPSSVSSYYTAEASPIRRVPVSAAGAASERTPMAAARSPYAALQPKDHYAPRYAPY